ncbi:MAG: hypothetical protein KGL39_11265 [Patescibacteria group bacterium]|nr:hypothetical protein [Patescibacteria group bacterium]
MKAIIQGSGGGKGGGGGATGITEAPNTLRSSQKAVVLDAWCEGPIAGLVNGAQSIYFNKTPLQNADGTWNFNQAVVGYSSGTQGAKGLSQVTGLAMNSTGTTVNVNAKVFQATPISYTITNSNVSAALVGLMVPQLMSTDSSSGNISGTSVEFTIAVNTNGGGFVTVVTDTISGKTTSQYARQYAVQLTGTGPWEIQVTRVTADSGSTLLANDLYFQELTEVIPANLEYRHTALAAISIDAQQFGSIPQRAYDVKGLIVNVPSNYNPTTRTYTGTWNGTFQLAWTDNPAWCFYDLLTNTRYGLGNIVDPLAIDKWTLYTIGQYCDQLVSDGFGGQEPRFTCNLLLNTVQDAYTAVQQFASIFRAICYWSAGSVFVSQDSPQTPSAMFTPANVIGGAFKYEGTSVRSRHTVAMVRWNDPNNFYQPAVEFVQREDLVQKYGVIKADVTAMGCTSRGQAHRVGQWLLYSEWLQTETITFRCSMDGLYLIPGMVIQTTDPNRAGQRMGGRLLAVDSGLKILTLDAAPPAMTSPSIMVALPDGTFQTEPVAGINGNVVTISTALTQTPVESAIYILTESSVEPEEWQVVTITEVSASEVEVSALSYNASKYGYIEGSLTLTTPSTSSLTTAPSAPTNLAFTTSAYTTTTGQAGLRGTLSWSQSAGAAGFIIEWQPSSGLKQTTTTTDMSLDIHNIEDGVSYAFTVVAYNVTGVKSAPANFSYTPSQSQVPISAIVSPSNLAWYAQYQVNAYGLLLTWSAPADTRVVGYLVSYKAVSDTAYTVLPLITSTSITISPLQAGSYDAQVVAVDRLGNKSPAVSVVANVQQGDMPTVSGLELYNQGINTVFSGKDAKFVWREASVTDFYNIGSEPYGGNSGSLDQYFKDYEVQILDVNTGAVLRTEYTTDNSYIYTYEKNFEDNAGAPQRTFTIKVYERGQQTQISSIPAQLTVNNPAPALPTGVNIRASFKQIFVGYTAPNDSDYAGIMVWMSTTSGFIPGSTNLVYQGSDTLPVIDAQPGTTYYLRYGCFDAFGTAGMNVSGEIAVTTDFVNTADIAAAAVTAQTLANAAVTANKTSIPAIDPTSGNLTLGSVGYTQFASGLTPVSIVSALPTLPNSNFPNNSVVSLSTDGKLYRNLYGAWQKGVDGSDILANSITSSQIAAGSITTTQLAAGAVLASNIAAGTILASNIAAGTISGSNISGLTITGDKIASNTIHAGNIAAGTITSSQIAAGTILGNNIAAGTVTAGNMSVTSLSSITANIGSVTSGNMTMDTTGFVKGGQTAYNTGNGFWLGYDSTSTTYRFSLGNSAGQGLTWDGTNLLINGSLTASAINAVNTINIAGNAVTVPLTATVASATGSTSTDAAYSDIRTTLFSITTSAYGSGNIVGWISSVAQALNISYTATVSATITWVSSTISLVRTVGGVDTVVFSSSTSAYANSPSATTNFWDQIFFDTPGPSVTATYSIVMHGASGVGIFAYSYYLCGLNVVAMEVKK